jgi:tryptophan 7-halogenase
VRDFVLLHYATARRDDTPFWQQATTRALPAALAQRIDVYRATGRIVLQRMELFTDLDWFFVLEGSGMVPRDFDPLVDTVDFDQVKRLMHAISQKVVADVGAAPSHDSFFAAANARIGSARKAAAGAPAG